jgi:site-specific recombinase XerD
MAHWVEVKRTVEALPMNTARQRAHAARTRWLLTLLYIGGLRVSEVCAGTMGGFFSRLSQDGRDRWWLEVLGKGQKLRLIPATPELMDELTRYRLACGLSPLPCTGDPTPLVLPLIGAALPMQRTGIHAIVKGLMTATADRLRATGDPRMMSAAEHIAQASTHWLRHTAGTHQSNGMDLKAVRDNLGHGSIATTNTYLHAEDDVRHDATSTAHRVAWTASEPVKPAQ